MQASAAITSRVAGISAPRVGKRFAPLPVKPLRTRTVVKASAKSEVRPRDGEIQSRCETIGHRAHAARSRRRRWRARTVFPDDGGPPPPFRGRAFFICFFFRGAGDRGCGAGAG